MITKQDFIDALGGEDTELGGDAFTVNTGADTLTITDHGRQTGDGPLKVGSSGTAPGGLTAQAATGVLTFGANPTEGQTVTIGSTVYTFRGTPSSAFDVDIGGSASGSLDNLIAAITAGEGEGTAYGNGTTAHPDVTASAGDSDTMNAVALVAGVDGNKIAVATNVTSGSWGDGVTALSGGYDNAFFVVVVDENTVQLAITREDAIAETPVVVDISSSGSGTHTLYSTASLFADRVEVEMIELLENGNRVTIRGAAYNRFWAGLTGAL